MIPHPEKRHKGGEDAYFLSEDGQVLGVADGVGGWALSGVDSGLYSKSLMFEAKKAVEAAKQAGVRPNRATDIMQKAYEHTKHVVGSSTAVILMVEGQTVKYSNLGDSGFMVIRGDKVAFRTREQTHAFNTPYQIGTGGDKPADAEEGRVSLQEGDVIVLGTDGLFDNLFDHEIVKIVEQGRNKKRDAAEVAEIIARQAHSAGAKVTGEMPFGKAAERYGYQYQGGKMDDVTVVVSFVSSSSSSSSSAPSSPPSSPQKAKF
jgi:protein phosphatase PTC7